MNTILGNILSTESDLFPRAMNFEKDVLAIRSRIMVETSLEWLKSDLSPAVVVEFMEFLRRPDIDADIEVIVDKNQGHGTLPPYNQAKQEIALKYFSTDYSLVSQLIELDEKMYELQKNSDFRKIIEERTRICVDIQQTKLSPKIDSIPHITSLTLDGVNSVLQQEYPDQSVTGIDGLIEEQNQYIEQMENMHFSELDENDRSAYLMMSAECNSGIRSRADLMTFWKVRTQ